MLMFDIAVFGEWADRVVYHWSAGQSGPGVVRGRNWTNFSAETLLVFCYLRPSQVRDLAQRGSLFYCGVSRAEAKNAAAAATAAARRRPKMMFLPASSWSLLLLLGHLAVGKNPSRDEGGYRYGQPVPVSCLNRTIESGEHIEDKLGRLQYIPFPTCNETSLPLALHYGVSETITCTIDALPDTLYHLFEYYVHSDAPLTCRVPTGPLSPSSTLDAGSKHVFSSSAAGKEYDIVDINSDGSAGDSGPPYTPLTIALQGTLQRSHLHIWTDMNVIVHQISSVESPRKKSKRATTTPGYVVAGTAYSVPELHSQDSSSSNSRKAADEDAALIENARNPWTAGHGSKVIRGEPLTFRFRVNWVAGADSLGWTTPASSSSSSSFAAFFSKLIFFIMAAGIGALAASYWERRIRHGGSGGWKGEGILGRPMYGGSNHSRRNGSGSGVTYGNSGRLNGYGGFSQGNIPAASPFEGGGSNGSSVAVGAAGGGGYGGFGAGYGKKD